MLRDQVASARLNRKRFSRADDISHSERIPLAKSRTEQQLQELDKLVRGGRITEEEYNLRRQAILSDTSVAPAKGGRGGIFKWGALGCLGIFAAIGIGIVVIVVVIIAAIGSSADTADDSGGDVRVALAPGAVGEISPENQGSRKLRVTILQVVDGASSENQFLSPEEGKKYWAVEVEVENIGSAEVSSPSWKLRDTTDIEHERTFFADVGENLETSFSLTPGGKLRGWVVFEIAVDASPRWLRADPNVILSDDLYFDAE
jgi:hypothetical protein